MPNVDFLTRSDVKRLSVVGKDLEIIDWVLYDRVKAGTAGGGGASQLRYFQQSQGTGGNSLETTNMEIPGQLPKGYRFICQKIVFSPQQAATLTGPDVRDIFKVTHAGRAQLFIGQRPYFQVPMVDLIGGGFAGFASTTGGADLSYATPKTVINGELEYSPAIPDNFSFSVLVDYDTAPAPVKDTFLYCQLVGKLIRPRQG